VLDKETLLCMLYVQGCSIVDEGDIVVHVVCARL
jgi:hypothetical protein